MSEMKELQRLIDHGHCVVIFKNDLGSYTSLVTRTDHEDMALVIEDADDEQCLTDHFTPEQSIAALAEKISHSSSEPKWIWGRATCGSGDAPVCSKCESAVAPDGMKKHKQECWSDGARDGGD